VVVEGVKEASKPPSWPKTGSLPALSGLKIAKNAAFRSKVLYKIYSQSVF
jgi:hypothetical protein